jgi:hypothetical protein
MLHLWVATKSNLKMGILFGSSNETISSVLHPILDLGHGI